MRVRGVSALNGRGEGDVMDVAVGADGWGPLVSGRGAVKGYRAAAGSRRWDDVGLAWLGLG